MSGQRENLQEALCQYTADTFTHIDIAKGFCESLVTWMDARKTELTKLKKETNQHDLAAVLKDTLGGLEKLDCFLDAVEKLAVSSLHVFTEENQVFGLPEGIIEHVKVVIVAARIICPLLLEFKRDASVFFLPKLQNVEVLQYQLDRYIQTTQKICDMLENSCISDFCLNNNQETVVDLDVDLSEDDIQRMLQHINQLDEIRMDPHFRMVFLFQEVSCSCFINEFSERQPRMLQFLKNLEESAVQLDRMNMGSKISSVAGSSVGAAGGVLSIVGLVLAPFTAGLSLAMTISGLGLAITSGVNTIVTTFTEMGVNDTQRQKANGAFQSFMEDMQSLQDCLEEVTSQAVTKIEAKLLDVILGSFKAAAKAGSVAKRIDSLAEAVSAAKALRSEELVVSVSDVVFQEGRVIFNTPRVTSDIGKAAVKGPLALSKSARAGFIGLNAFFIGMDVFFICVDSISLAKGNETEASRFIRARAALFSSEMDSWQKIHDSLCKGLLTSEKNQMILEAPFY